MTDTILTEQYLLGTMNAGDRTLMEARLLLEPALRDTCKAQEQTYSLIKAYGRNMLRKDIEAVHTQLFSDSRFRTFRNKISTIFNRTI